jgi:FkbM family methyltransferase
MPLSLRRVLRRLSGYLLREIVWSERTYHNTLLSISLLGLTPLSVLGKGVSLTRKIAELLARHRANYIMEKYGIKLLGNLPSDLFWRDYFQVPGFLEGCETVIDVGASIGDFSIVVAKRFGAKKVIAIEPDETLFDILVKNIKINRLEHIVKPVRYALGDRKGLVELYKSGDFITAIGSGHAEPRLYPSTTLDELVEELGLEHVNLMKIDTEGSELLILKGALRTLRRFKPKIIVEVHSRRLRNEVLRMLSRINYKLIYEKINFPEGYKGTDYVRVLCTFIL